MTVQLIIPREVYQARARLEGFLESLGISAKQINDVLLFLCVFVHKSYASDFKISYNHNERLEFVGDAMLGSIIAKKLFLSFPEMKESTMTLYKIALVREETLSKVAKKIWLHHQLFISHGEEKNDGRNKASITSDALEALIGYIAIDMGYKMAEEFVLKYVYSEMETLAHISVKSYKTRAQESIQKIYKQLPIYLDYEDQKDIKGNVLQFRSEITIDQQVLAVGFWTNKKKAQEDAAKQYCESLQTENPEEKN